MRNKILNLTLLFIALFVLARAYYAITDDFQYNSITEKVEHRREWSTSTSLEDQKQLKNIVKQEFRYLGKGAQVYAFVSEDNQYVLKFFKFKHLKPSLFMSKLPEIGFLKTVKENYLARKNRKIRNLYLGYYNAFVFDRDYSGLVYLHLNPTDDLKTTVTIVDKIGRVHKVDLDSTVFIVQHKGRTSHDVFKEAFENKDVALAIKRATQILDMYIDEYRKGVWDRDHGISHNTGFIKNKPFHLDVGKFSYDGKMQPIEFYQNDLKHVAYKMEEWVQKHYPKNYAEFHEQLDAHLQKLIHEFPLSFHLPALSSSSPSEPSCTL